MVQIFPAQSAAQAVAERSKDMQGQFKIMPFVLITSRYLISCRDLRVPARNPLSSQKLRVRAEMLSRLAQAPEILSIPTVAFGIVQ
jgi:hypothetical protein